MKTGVRWAGIAGWGVLALGMSFPAEPVRGGIEADWAYHASANDLDERATEHVPGSDACFVGGCSVRVSGARPVILHLLTENDFAGDAEEQVWVRWWNGTEARWIPGKWEANIQLGSLGGDATADYVRAAGSFRGLPSMGSKMVDLWTVEISPEDTAPGINYYSIQLKGVGGGDGESKIFLLRYPIGEDGPINNLGQAWTADEAAVYGHDWTLEVKDDGEPAAAEMTPEVPGTAH